MKKNLRLLCLGLAAAAFTGSFAQTAQNKTDLLKNPGMEPGIKAWSVISAKPMGLGNKNNGAGAYGFHGTSTYILEAWNGKDTKPGTGGQTGVPEEKYFPALPDGYAMQRLSGLESGTYVFGAYAGAACQGDSLPESYKNIKGVTLFANDNEVAVATNNPEAKGLPQWAHTGKFNVAVTLTDQDDPKGYLDLGLRIEGTNANYVLMDNATLYYFGNMSEAEALDAMAAIDITTSLGIADTLVTDTLVLNVDTLANFNSALETAHAAVKEGTVTAANAWALDEAIYYNKGLVHKSVGDYKNLKRSIDAAQEVIDSCHLWQVNGSVETEDAYWAFFFPMLEEPLAAAKKLYEGRKANREEIDELREALRIAVGDVKTDSVFTVQYQLKDFIMEASKDGAPYTAVQVKNLEKLDEELGDTIEKYFDDLNKWSENLIEERTIDPNDLYAYVARVQSTIKSIKENPVSNDYTQMPILYPRSTEAISTNAGSHKYAKGSFKNSDGLLEFTSPLYRFEGKVSTFRITVTGSGTNQTFPKNNPNGHVFFTLSGLKFWDAQGAEIPLDATMVTSNADHNEKNPNGKDGQGIPALFDNDGTTYFHSCWENGPDADHYLEITLPNGGYDAFSFTMVSRQDGDGGTQHNFPAEFTVDTPKPNRDALAGNLEKLKGLNAYSIAQIDELGFYNVDFSYVLDAIAEAEALLESHPSEAVCAEMNNTLIGVENRFNKEEDKTVKMPETNKVYRFVSAHPGFVANQQLEKAYTFHAVDSTLWWETSSVDSTEQEFVLEPWVDEEGFTFTEDDTDGALLYLYSVKNVKTGLYLSNSFTQASDKNNRRVKFVAKRDTVRLKSLGLGQWQIKLFHSMEGGKRKFEGLDMYNHGAGGKYAETDRGYGDENSHKGNTSHVGPYTEGRNTGSALYIREYDVLPAKVEVKAGEFKSALFNFAPANNIELTANADCAFEGLALFTLMGDSVAVDTIIVAGNKAHIVTPKDIVECSFAFNAPAGVSEVELKAYHYISKLGDLQAAYDEAVALAPVVGDSIGQVKSVEAYEEVMAAAEAMLELGAATDDEMVDMIKRIKAAVKGLEYVQPVAGTYYQIVTALEGFVKNNGYRVSFYADEKEGLLWAPENDVDHRFYWFFEPATKAELVAVGAPDSVTAFFVKNVGTQQYIGGFRETFPSNAVIPMANSKEDAMPYIVKSLGGAIVGLDAAVERKEDGNKQYRLHANGHGSGANRTGKSTYWNSGIESSSAWYIVDVEFDVTDIDFTEVETEAPVVKGIYDIFGRRVVAPTAPGLYIIDGKKRYIK